MGRKANLAATAVAAAASLSPVAAAPTDACKLLTPVQVSAAAGVQVGAGTYVTPTFTRTCTWTASGTIVTLYLQPPGLFDAGRSAMAPGTTITPVAGVGADAYYRVMGSIIELMVRKGDASFKVTIYSKAPIDSRKAAERTLALRVASEL